MASASTSLRSSSSSVRRSIAPWRSSASHSSAEQLVGDIERLRRAIERAAGLRDRFFELAEPAQRAREIEPRVDVIRIVLEHRAELADRAGKIVRERSRCASR